MAGSQTHADCCAEAKSTHQNEDPHDSHASNSKAAVEGIANEGGIGNSKHALSATASKAEGSTDSLAAQANRSTDGAAS